MQQVAERIVGVSRKSDTCARFGGDEFTVLVGDLSSESDAIPCAEKILRVVDDPIHVADSQLNITASIGITIFPNDGEDAETLLKHADNAMYAAKDEGRNTYRFFTPTMHEQALYQHRIANDIKYAVKYRKFLVHYQPVFDLQTGAICGAEALLRWRHPNKGFIAPDEFIHIAESLNLISTIGEFVLAKACRFIAMLNKKVGRCLSVSVNFSSYQFIHGSCVERWLDIIEGSEIGCANVIIEITESLMLSHKDRYLEQLHILREHGVRIALDDFGTGYSSLSYLKRLPIDVIKIDQSFIRDILLDQSDASLVETILAIAQNFSLNVIAEGVEQKQQAEFLIARDCRFAQGFYFSKPVSGKQFAKLVLNQSIV